jgi:hypothetical protein
MILGRVGFVRKFAPIVGPLTSIHRLKHLAIVATPEVAPALQSPLACG